MPNNMMLCSGCEKPFHDLLMTRYRNKMCCGSEDCMSVIDQRINLKNKKKRNKRYGKGVRSGGLGQSNRRFIMQRDEFRCGICNALDAKREPSLQVHHIVPVAHDGSDEATNLITLCPKCHQELHSDDWRVYEKALSLKAIENMGKVKQAR